MLLCGHPNNPRFVFCLLSGRLAISLSVNTHDSKTKTEGLGRAVLFEYAYLVSSGLL